jgi:hypothetical protein
MKRDTSHPNFKLWVGLSIIPLAIIVLAYLYYLVTY